MNDWVEPVGVLAYEVFDAAGQRLDLSVSGSEVSVHRAGISDHEALSKCLRMFLERCRQQVPSPDTLEELLAAVRRVAG